uniref:Uncharacterized protein n=1 Tax=Palpitomonas bilix TaxID=652834 RepID=A0A7S3DAB0_9EUKA
MNSEEGSEDSGDDDDDESHAEVGFAPFQPSVEDTLRKRQREEVQRQEYLRHRTSLLRFPNSDVLEKEWLPAGVIDSAVLFAASKGVVEADALLGVMKKHGDMWKCMSGSEAKSDSSCSASYFSPSITYGDDCPRSSLLVDQLLPNRVLTSVKATADLAQIASHLSLELVLAFIQLESTLFSHPFATWSTAEAKQRRSIWEDVENGEFCRPFLAVNACSPAFVNAADCSSSSLHDMCLHLSSHLKVWAAVFGVNGLPSASSVLNHTDILYNIWDLQQKERVILAGMASLFDRFSSTAYLSLQRQLEDALAIGGLQPSNSGQGHNEVRQNKGEDSSSMEVKRSVPYMMTSSEREATFSTLLSLQKRWKSKCELVQTLMRTMNGSTTDVMSLPLVSNAFSAGLPLASAMKAEIEWQSALDKKYIFPSSSLEKSFLFTLRHHLHFHFSTLSACRRGLDPYGWYSDKASLKQSLIEAIEWAGTGKDIHLCREVRARGGTSVSAKEKQAAAREIVAAAERGVIEAMPAAVSLLSDGEHAKKSAVKAAEIGRKARKMTDRKGAFTVFLKGGGEELLHKMNLDDFSDFLSASPPAMLSDRVAFEAERAMLASFQNNSILALHAAIKRARVATAMAVSPAVSGYAKQLKSAQTEAERSLCIARLFWFTLAGSKEAADILYSYVKVDVKKTKLKKDEVPMGFRSAEFERIVSERAGRLGNAAAAFEHAQYTIESGLPDSAVLIALKRSSESGSLQGTEKLLEVISGEDEIQEEVEYYTQRLHTLQAKEGEEKQKKKESGSLLGSVASMFGNFFGGSGGGDGDDEL